MTLNSPVGGDAHLAGFNVAVPAAVVGDIYAAGFTVNVSAPVGGDVTAFANSVSLMSSASVGGNARLAGANVTLAAAVTGSALITAETLTLDAPVTGDLSFYGNKLNFAPGAKVTGLLSIHAPQPIAVPESVAAANQVRFEQLVSPDYVGEAGRPAGHVVNRFWPAVWSAAIGGLLLLAVGAAFIAWAPRTVEMLRTAAERRPFRQLGLGFIGFAAVLGLVPVTVMTLIGIFVLPFVLVFVAIACALAWLTGAYVIGWLAARAFVGVDTNAKHLLVLTASIIVAGLLGAAPVLGWLITLLVIVFGFGAMGLVLMVRWSAKDAARLSSPLPQPSAQPATV